MKVHFISVSTVIIFSSTLLTGSVLACVAFFYIFFHFSGPVPAPSLSLDTKLCPEALTFFWLSSGHHTQLTKVSPTMRLCPGDALITINQPKGHLATCLMKVLPTEEWRIVVCATNLNSQKEFFGVTPQKNHVGCLKNISING